MDSVERASRASAMGRPVPATMLAPLQGVRVDPAVMATLPERLARDGYLYLRGLLPEKEVLAARQAILERLEAIDEIAAPAAARAARRSRQILALGQRRAGAAPPDGGAGARRARRHAVRRAGAVP